MVDKTYFEKDSLQVIKWEETKHFVVRTFWMYIFCHNNGKDNFCKVDAHSDNANLLGYALNNKAYRVCKLRNNNQLPYYQPKLNTLS